MFAPHFRVRQSGSKVATRLASETQKKKKGPGSISKGPGSTSVCAGVCTREQDVHQEKNGV